MTLGNRSGEPQQIAIRSIDTVVRVPAPSIADRPGAPKVEVVFRDDGASTIHKARVMEDMAWEFSAQRFFRGTVEPAQVKLMAVIFDEDDVDWDGVYEQVERIMTGDISIGYGREPLEPGLQSFLPTPEKLKGVQLRRLTDDEKALVREEVLSAIPSALAAQRDPKIVTANVSAECGIASGEFRVVRSYFEKGIIESGWLHQWTEGGP
jgi:hypothetical protein